MPNWLNLRGAGGGDETPERKPINKDDKLNEITPESINKSLTDTKTDLEKKLADLGESINQHPTLLAMQEFLDGQKANKDAAARKAANDAANANNSRFENVDQTTREYVNETMKPYAEAAIYQQGNEQRRTIFEDAEAFPYYTGTLKSKVDALLDAQPPVQRANPDVIRNVYKIVVFDHQKEISEDKIKSRLSSASTPTTGAGTSSSGDKGALPVLTQQMKSVARSMGMSEADYATAMKELQETGEYA
jgi:hypothetical protein